MELWQISVAVIALAFAVLVFFVIKTLRSLQTSLNEANETIVKVQKELNDVTVEVKGVLRNTNQITLDLRTKMRSLDSLFGTVENVGDTLEGVTSSIKTASSHFFNNVENSVQLVDRQHDKKVYKTLNWITSIYDIWKRMKVHRLSNQQVQAHR